MRRWWVCFLLCINNNTPFCLCTLIFSTVHPSMGFKSHFVTELLSLLKFSIYPLIELYGYFVFIGLLCLQAKNINPWLLVFFFIVYHFLLTNKIVCFMQLFIKEGCSTLEIFPHVLKTDKTNDFEDINPFIRQNVLEKNIEKSQFCNICNTFKPPRCHHCSKCNRCYLKYDHHCGVFDTCIGYHNYKYFFQFLFFNVVGCLFYIAVIALELIISGDDLITSLKVNFIITIILFAAEFLVTLVLMIFHMRLISRNETTIEYFALNSYLKGDHSYIHIFQEGPIKNFKETNDRTVLNPYNLGIYENWKQVFGEKALDFFNPTFTTLGNGIKFKTNEYKQGQNSEI